MLSFRYVTNLSASKKEKKQDTRVFKAHEDSGRKACYSKPQSKRKKETSCLDSACFMLAKKYRLPIQSVLNKRGQSFKSRSFLFKIFLGVVDYNRFGVVISKKVDKKAVVRNKLKRIILDAAKKFVCLTNDKNKTKHDILIIVSSAVAKLEKTDIIKEIEESLLKII